MAVFKYYNIKSKLSGFVLDIVGEVAYPGCPVGLWERGKDKSNQQWRFDDASKTIRSRQGDDQFVLDINDDNGLIVNVYDSTKANQRWQRDGDKLLNVDDPRFCLDVSDSDYEKGAKVIKYAYYGTDNQFWDFIPPLRHEFYIISLMHGKVATINADGKLEIQPRAATANKNQHFYTDFNGYLHSSTNDLALTAKRGEQFSLSPDSADPSTQWQFNAKGNKVVNPAGSVFDIAQNSKADGAKIASWDDFDQENQQWKKVDA